MFAVHLTEVFKPHCTSSNLEEVKIIDYLQSSFQMSLLQPQRNIVQLLNSKKAVEHDRIINKAIKKLPKKGIAFLTSIFNAILRLGYLKSWKLSIITLSISRESRSTRQTHIVQSVYCQTFLNYLKSYSSNVSIPY